MMGTIRFAIHGDPDHYRTAIGNTRTRSKIAKGLAIPVTMIRREAYGVNDMLLTETVHMFSSRKVVGFCLHNSSINLKEYTNRLRTPPSHSPPGREYGYQPRSPPRRRYGGSERGRVKDQNHGSLLVRNIPMKSEVMGMQEQFRSHIKEHINANVDLQDTIHENNFSIKQNTRKRTCVATIFISIKNLKDMLHMMLIQGRVEQLESADMMPLGCHIYFSNLEV
ncbi:hypothetical protein Tco_1050044 [Tanacetum coccineum]